jgi:hypothetical protein
MGPSPLTAQLVTQHTLSGVCSPRDARPALTKVGDVFFQHELVWVLAIAYSAFGEHRFSKRVRFQQRRFPPSWAPESNSSQHVLEFGERVVLAAAGRQPMGTESVHDTPHSEIKLAVLVCVATQGLWSVRG